MNEAFRVVGIRQSLQLPAGRVRRNWRGKPLLSALLFVLIVTGCLACDLLMTKDPSYMDLQHYCVPPDGTFLVGTDTMGRDIFSMSWYGGRISLGIGFGAAFIQTSIAVILGAVSGCAPKSVDRLIMGATDILLSIPNLLAVVLLQAALGKGSVPEIAFVIGITGWMSMCKVVRTQVRQIRNSEYVIASKCMGGGFFHVLWHHLAPNFVSSVLFMAVMSVRNAIVAESTLSFMGIGLPVEVISWGSMLSLANQALSGRAWWMILIPGLFLVVTLVCLTNLGNHLRRRVNRRHSNL